MCDGDIPKKHNSKTLSPPSESSELKLDIYTHICWNTKNMYMQYDMKPYENFPNVIEQKIIVKHTYCEGTLQYACTS